MKHIIDLETYDRKGNYEFFKTFVNSWYSVTTEFDCTRSFAEAKAKGRSFFLYYLYAMLHASNQVEAMRYRIDKNGRIAYYDTVDIITPIAVPGKSFVTVLIPYHEDFETFYNEAKKIIAGVSAEGDAYGAEAEILEKGDYDIVHLSATPRLYFTSNTFTVHQAGKGCTYPLSVMGKAIKRGDRLVMPYSIYVDHTFVDGSHLSDFFEKIQEKL